MINCIGNRNVICRNCFQNQKDKVRCVYVCLWREIYALCGGNCTGLNENGKYSSQEYKAICKIVSIYDKERFR